MNKLVQDYALSIEADLNKATNDEAMEFIWELKSYLDKMYIEYFKNWLEFETIANKS